MFFTAAEIAEKVRGEVIGDGSIHLTGFAPAGCAMVGDLTFAEQDSYFAAAEASPAAAILVAGAYASPRKVLIRVRDARVAVARLLPLFFPPDLSEAGCHASAAIAASARVDPTAYVGPHCVVGEGVHIGARSVLMGGNHIGRDVRIGDDAPGVEKTDVAEAVAARARAHRVVEREQPRFEFRQRIAAHRAGELG